MKNENRTCFECAGRNPTWISITYGVYLCLDCSGEHRRKGVHISFVRSVDMDKFTPENMVQMAVGGNGKAWNYFKQQGMGKTSDAGRAVDYNSKITLRYRQQLEKEVTDGCAKLGILQKQASGGDKPVVAEDSAAPLTEDAKPSLVETANADPAPTPPPAIVPAPKPKPTGPTSIIVRRAKAPPPAQAAVQGGYAAQAESAPVASPSPITSQPRPVSAAQPAQQMPAQTKAKQMEFDFDFDSLEEETSKPAAATPSAVAVAAPTPATKPVQAPSISSMGTNFSNKKGISSDDFFGN
eukprot:TRINITY_DN21151_c0_g1_i2.p1 TRINITY_DN21151_c0_g1~~TRINITY_DN21151_c0_g1_i2.p1  ORF type:complete len:296 (-),score=66.84 TRINITY_DN21151_c0_g1_i2:170-1057(-)